MTPQEQQMLQDLTTRIANTPLTEKDPEAEQYLQQTLGRNPDALYILAQTTLVQQYALEQAKKQLDVAKSQLDQLRQQPPPEPKHATSFLGSLFGHADDTAPRQPPPPQPQYTPVPNYPPPQYSAPVYAQPQYAQPAYGMPQAPLGQSGGFLRSAMQTATGVAAGALAFEGIESLMHGFGGGGGSRGFDSFGGGMGGGRPEEIVNNYYGDSAPHEHGNLGPDIEDRRNDTPHFADTTSSKDDLLDTSGDDLDSSDTQANASDTSDFDSGGNDDSSSGNDDSSSGNDDSSSGNDDSSSGSDDSSGF